ncbi:TLR4 interactor with leucine rich repeats [Nilaparvata lugens]|uniref:TLR4 interactor with leucine rich repeats n=1 Tax=Nilaparvata lugens TaxID=108931 RepID=UPI00193DE020|nr:TLR4 interactor with leucine rich repeats [Nilaparvata lugens]XP_039276642.1 TLR4 interactor with leucine rich repeats [Nilaparvata lugens]
MLGWWLWCLVAVAWLGVLGADAEAGAEAVEWQCPMVEAAACSCDLPHTLRCAGDRPSLDLVASRLRQLSAAASVSLLDCTVQNLTQLAGPFLQGVMLHGLVISSGELRQVKSDVFTGLATPLQALGLPNNLLDAIPSGALSALKSLDRLDLSHNKIVRIENSSFEGMSSITFLDMSDNVLKYVSPDAFVQLPLLRILRLQGNRLGVGVISALQGFRALEELDLSGNSLAGPLGPTTLPRLPSLHVLSLAHNQLSSVSKGALAGLDQLRSLSLHHNQIDVLEDHAFRAVGTLTQLDLSHNRMVAVSGASLAHLTRLAKLDVAHNFLRALTSDLILPLKSLQELKLDDNDISMVASDALLSSPKLNRLTLSDNPLNCDCSLSQFAHWLGNVSSLPAADKATAVCATPPQLENGLVQELTATDLVCGDLGDPVPSPAEGPLATPMPVSGTRVVLRAFQYDGIKVSLLWSVDANSATYSCDALFIYEELGVNEILLESNPLQCDSTQLVDPRSLSLALPATDLQPGHRYRYCVVLLEGKGGRDDSALVLGCSEVIPLVPTSKSRAQPIPGRTHIANVDANLTALGTMAIAIQLWSDQTEPHCILTLSIFVEGNLVAQRHVNCSIPWAVVHGLPKGPYQVCATLGDFPPTEPKTKCVTVRQASTEPHHTLLNRVLIVSLFILSGLLLIAVYHTIRKILKRPKEIRTHQCFLPVTQPEEQHSRYVKLQATTKL